MNYLDEIGGQIQAAVPPNRLPDDDTRTLFRLYALLLLAKGEDVDAADVHNAWSAWMADRDSAHDSIVPFDELSTSVTREDEPYVTAIKLVARSRQAPSGSS